MLIIPGLIGLALLAFGRKGLALCLGAIGFVVGMSLTTRLFDPAPTGLVIAIAIAGGIIGVFIAFAIEKVATVLVDLGGGYIGMALADSFGWNSGGFPWIRSASVPCSACFWQSSLLKWALIILSSLVGAYLVVGAFQLHALLATPLFIALAIAGIWFQAVLRTVKKEGRINVFILRTGTPHAYEQLDLPFSSLQRGDVHPHQSPARCHRAPDVRTGAATGTAVDTFHVYVPA